MTALADGFVALPGGAGTLDEWFEAWTWGQLGLHTKPLALFDIGGFWRPLAGLLDHLVTTGFLAADHRDSLVVEDDAHRLLERLRTWSPPAPKWVDRAARLSSVGLVAIRDGHLLVARSHGADAFFLPGGKLENGETERDALRREVREELGMTLRQPNSNPASSSRPRHTARRKSGCTCPATQRRCPPTRRPAPRSPNWPGSTMT